MARQKFVRRNVVTLLVLGLVLSSWLGWESLFRSAAALWIVSDPVNRADAIVVLGGDARVRPKIAAELYHKDLGNRVLISKTGGLYKDLFGASISEEMLNRGELLKLGLPSSALDTFGRNNKSTRDEAVALKEWADRNHASAFIIVTEIFAARRVEWIFRREFSDTSVTIQVFAFESPFYTRGAWWKTEQGSAAFQSEVLKYLYYRWKY